MSNYPPLFSSIRQCHCPVLSWNFLCHLTRYWLGFILLQSRCLIQDHAIDPSSQDVLWWWQDQPFTSPHHSLLLRQESEERGQERIIAQSRRITVSLLPKGGWENSKGNICRNWRCHQGKRESSHYLESHRQHICCCALRIYLSRGRETDGKQRDCLHSDFWLDMCKQSEDAINR